MSSRVLVIPRRDAPPLPESGAWPRRDSDWPTAWRWLPRAEAETDEGFLQIIPYALLQNPKGELWCYGRTGGDARLLNRLSCGVGGHIDEADAAGDLSSTVCRALRRELREELVWEPDPPLPPPRAWLYEGLSAIGRVHLGLIHVLPWRHPEPPRPAEGEALADLGFLPACAIAADPRFELWSRLAAGFLRETLP